MGVKITDREIWESLQALHAKVDKLQGKQGKIEMAIGAGAAILTAIAGILFQHIAKN